METYNTPAYLIYLPIVLLLTFVTARVLFKNSKVFMLDIFHGREPIAYATNQLFEIGFYLLNIGTAFFLMKVSRPIFSTGETVEVLSQKVGLFSFYLGIMLFLNLYLFFRGKKKAKQSKQPELPKTAVVRQP